jgi:hypothetical protein
MTGLRPDVDSRSDSATLVAPVVTFGAALDGAGEGVDAGDTEDGAGDAEDGAGAAEAGDGDDPGGGAGEGDAGEAEDADDTGAGSSADSAGAPYVASSSVGTGLYSSHRAACRRREIMAPAAPTAAPAASRPASAGQRFFFDTSYSLRALAAPSLIWSYNGAKASLVVCQPREAT